MGSFGKTLFTLIGVLALVATVFTTNDTQRQLKPSLTTTYIDGEGEGVYADGDGPYEDSEPELGDPLESIR